MQTNRLQALKRRLPALVRVALVEDFRDHVLDKFPRAAYISIRIEPEVDGSSASVSGMARDSDGREICDEDLEVLIRNILTQVPVATMVSIYGKKLIEIKRFRQ